MKNLIVAKSELPTFDFLSDRKTYRFAKQKHTEFNHFKKDLSNFRFQSILKFKITRVVNTVVEEWF